MKFCKFIGDNVYILYTFLFLFKIRLEFGWNFCSFIGDWKEIMYVFYTHIYILILDKGAFGWNFVSLMIGRGNVMIIEVQRESKSLALIYILKYVYLWFSGSVWL